MALLSDSRSQPHYLREQSNSAVGPELLEFLGRVQPKSQLLREYCMRSLLLTHGHWPNDPAMASELLGRDFSTDLEVRQAIRSELLGHLPAIGLRAILALCDIWPDSPELNLEYDCLRDDLASRDWLIGDPMDMPLVCAKAPPREVLFVLAALLRQPRPTLRYFAEQLRKPVLRRLSRDPNLQQLVWERLLATTNPSEQATFASMLGAIQGLRPELREWCQQQLEASVARSVSPVGTDLLTGVTRPVWEFAANLLLQEVWR